VRIGRIAGMGGVIETNWIVSKTVILYEQADLNVPWQFDS
jgi:hypothetical protein